MINDCAEKFDIPILGIDVQPPQAFHDLSLYYNYLISVLRLQNGYQNFNNINCIFRVSLFVSFL